MNIGGQVKPNVRLKAPRADHFAEVEKELLLSLVEQNYDVVENKEIDSHSNKKKIECWEKIENEFNSSTTLDKRTKEQLSHLWKSLKRRVKGFSTERQSMPPAICNEVPNIDAICKKVYELIEGKSDIKDEVDGDTGLDEDSVVDIISKSDGMIREILVAASNSSATLDDLLREKKTANCSAEVDVEEHKMPRTPNFSQREKELLVGLVDENIKIIENKRTDTLTNKRKDECWEKIKEEFNLIATEQSRTKRQLISLWKNMKTKARMAHAERKLPRVGTGLPLSEFPVDPLEIIERQAETKCESARLDTVSNLESTGGRHGTVQQIWVSTGNAATSVIESSSTSKPSENCTPEFTVEINGPMNEEQKYPRSQNFTYSEKEFFVSLVEQNLKIIENKKSDSVTNKQKDKCWEKIAKEYNLIVTGQIRSKRQLISLWKNMKRKSKMVHTEQRLHRMATGQSLPESPLSRLDERVRELVERRAEPRDADSTHDSVPDITEGSQDTMQEIWVATGDASISVNEPTSSTPGISERSTPSFTVEINDQMNGEQGDLQMQDFGQRMQNFSYKEKEFLVGLVEQNFETVEDKRADSLTNKRKDNCWDKIENEFNSAGTEQMRSKKQLMCQWKKMKAKSKKTHSEQRLFRMATGRSPPESVVDPLDERIHEMIKWKVGTREEETRLDMIAASVMAGDSRDAMQEILVATGDASVPVKEPTPSALQISKTAIPNQTVQINGADTADEIRWSLARSEHDIRMEILKAEHKAKMNLIETKISLLKRKAENEETIFSVKMKVLGAQLKQNNFS